MDKITVTFESKYDDSLGFDKDIINPYISLEYPDEDMSKQKNPDEIVILMNKIRILFDYPLEKKIIYKYKSKNVNGFTRNELAGKISKTYKKIYKEEEDVKNPGHIEGMLNRKQSHGRHGIWGHDLGDLQLVRIIQVKGDLFELVVDS